MKAILFILFLLIGLILMVSVNAEITGYIIGGTETMTRTAGNLDQSVGSVTGLIRHDAYPNTTKTNSVFLINYTAQGTSGTWGATIVDNVSVGGCRFPGGATYRDVMLSYAGNIRTLAITAPSSAGSCTFTGDYQFGTYPIRNFSILNVTICNPSCVRPSGSCQATSNDGCGGICNWQITQQNTPADINCDGIVDRNELGDYIDRWVNGQVTRQSLGEVIMAWAT